MKKVLAIVLGTILLIAAAGNAFAAENAGFEPMGVYTLENGGTVYVGPGTSLDRRTPADSFTLGASEEPSTLEPAEAQLISGWIITGAIFDNLITMDEKGNYNYVLAESMEYTDDTTLMIKIREGVHFHDGSALTADDVLFTLERLATSSRYATNYSCIDFENSKVLDDTTLEVKFNTTYAPFLSYLCHPSAGVISRSYFEANGEEGLARNPMGTGPFVFDEWVSGDHVSAHLNEEYWGDKPAYSNLNVRFIVEPTTRMIEFQTGGVDAIIDPSSTDVQSMKNQEVENVRLYSLQGEKISRLEMNDQFEPFQDERVRQAIAHAIEFAPAVNIAFGSIAEYTTNELPRDCKFFVETAGYEYDLELAKSLMEEAGYAEGFTVQAACGSSTSEAKMMEIIQSQLQEINITVNLELTDQMSAIEKMRTGEAIFGVIGGTVTVKDPDQAISNVKTSSPFAISSKSDETLNELLLLGAQSTDDAVRAQAYADAMNYIQNHVVNIPFAVSVVSYGVYNYIDYFPASASGYIDARAITFK